MADFVGAVEQGTTSARFMLLDQEATRWEGTSSRTRRSCRELAGLSTARSRSGNAPARWSRPR